jgi:hypothetical protein
MGGTVPIQNFAGAIIHQRLHALDLPLWDAVKLGPGGKKYLGRSPVVFSLMPGSQGHRE